MELFISVTLTLTDLAQKTMGSQTRFLVALIIVITWIGIIAAQFIAAGKVLTALTRVDSHGVLALAAVITVVYSFLGGQASILKTDFLRFVLLSVADLIIRRILPLQPFSTFEIN